MAGLLVAAAACFATIRFDTPVVITHGEGGEGYWADKCLALRPRRGETSGFLCGLGPAAFLSTDAGKTWVRHTYSDLGVCSQGACVPGPSPAATGHSGETLIMHDFGQVGITPKPDTDYKNFSSPAARWLSMDESGKTISQEKQTQVIFDGLPWGVRCNKTSHWGGWAKGDCAWWGGDASDFIRINGRAHGIDGPALLQTTVVAWLGGNEGATHANEGVHAFVSAASDTLNWTYATTIAKDRMVPNGGEGASENSLVRLADNKTIMMVVRYAGGDGGLWQSPQCGTCGPITISKMPQCRDQCYKNYRRFLSKDEGRHWSGPFELPNTGSCRPRLLMMGGGKGPLILSGGCSVNRGRYDVSMWVTFSSAA